MPLNLPGRLSQLGGCVYPQPLASLACKCPVLPSGLCGEVESPQLLPSPPAEAFSRSPGSAEAQRSGP